MNQCPRCKIELRRRTTVEVWCKQKHRFVTLCHSCFTKLEEQFEGTTTPDEA